MFCSYGSPSSHPVSFDIGTPPMQLYLCDLSKEAGLLEYFCSGLNFWRCHGEPLTAAPIAREFYVILLPESIRGAPMKKILFMSS